MNTLVNSDNILEISNLSKVYHTNKSEISAIDNLNLNIKDGEFVAIVGPSGCGKTTLLSILCGLEDKSSGEILYSKDELRMGYMLQNDTLFPWLNILDNCLLGVKIKKEVTKENIDRVKTLLETYGLSDFAYKYPRNLSGGMRQRVALIRTLAINPDILLLDEPFSALDYQTRLAVSDDVWKIIKKEKKTTIMITHDVAEAISMADRVVVLSNRPARVKSIYNIEMKNKGTPIGNRNKEEFQRPPVESIKSILNHIESGVFYFPMTSYFDAIGLSRFQSNMKFLREFYPYNFLEMLL